MCLISVLYLGQVMNAVCHCMHPVARTGRLLSFIPIISHRGHAPCSKDGPSVGHLSFIPHIEGMHPVARTGLQLSTCPSFPASHIEGMHPVARTGLQSGTFPSFPSSHIEGMHSVARTGLQSGTCPSFPSSHIQFDACRLSVTNVIITWCN